MLRKPGLLTSGEMEAERLVGPMAPATKRGLSGVSARHFVGGRTRQPRTLPVHLEGDVLHAVVGLRHPRRRKGVGFDDVGAGPQVVEVDVADDVGLCQHQKIVVSAHVLRPVLEPFTAEFRLFQAVRLDHRAHGAVEHQDAFRRDGAETGFGIGRLAGGAHAAASFGVGLGGLMPSRWQMA